MGITPKELENLVELPEEMKAIWKYFMDLNRRRSSTGYGPLPIQYSEILSYFQLLHIDYELIEVEILLLLDDVAMEHYSKQLQDNNNKK